MACTLSMHVFTHMQVQTAQTQCQYTWAFACTGECMFVHITQAFMFYSGCYLLLLFVP